MKTRTVLALSLVLILSVGLVACSNDSPEAMSPEKLGEIGAKLHDHPNRYESLLKEASLTVDEFKQRLDEVSSDPELSERYYTSFRRAKQQ